MVVAKIGCNICKQNAQAIATIRKGIQVNKPVLKCKHNIGVYYRIERNGKVSFAGPSSTPERSGALD